MPGIWRNGGDGDMKKSAVIGIALLIWSSFLWGCDGKDKDDMAPRTENAGGPEWVLRGSGTSSDDGSVFHGVGSARGIRNYSLLRSTADNRARNEVAKIFHEYMAFLVKDRHATKGGGAPGPEMKRVALMTLSGVEIIDHWRSPDKTRVFSLARLDLETLKGNIKKLKGLDDKVKEDIIRNADRRYKEFTKRKRG